VLHGIVRYQEISQTEKRAVDPVLTSNSTLFMFRNPDGSRESSIAGRNRSAARIHFIVHPKT